MTDIDTKQKKKAATRDGRQPFVALIVLVFAASGITQGNITLAELSTGKIDRRNKHPYACDTYKIK